MSLPAGTVLRGNSFTYKIERALGQGSFGITYLADASVEMKGELGTLRSSMRVAIKEFFMKEINGREGSTVTKGSKGGVVDDYRKKFRREAANLAKLHHPNIVQVLESFDANDTSYYVMEYIDGVNLDKAIEAKSGLGEAESLAIMKQVCSAVSFMHNSKMLHLDIKPGNIMLRKNGDAVLIDFGLSKQYDNKGQPETSTTIGSGTTGYAPIEQANYHESDGFPVTMDVYALGGTLFKMLTGHRPPEASEILNEGFPWGELKQHGVSDDTITAVRQAMAPLKRQRTKSVRLFAEMLTGGTGEDTDIRPEHQSYSQSNDQQGSHSEPSVSQSQQHPAHKPGKWIWMAGGMVAVIIVIGIIKVASGGSTKPSSVNDSDTLSVVDEPQKVLSHIEDMSWDSPLGKATYSGDVEYSDGNYVPHGNGVARITSGKYAGCVYAGEFFHGVMEGHTTYKLKNGDTFEGTFKHNEYEKGRYKLKSTGEYFEGTFINSQPSSGIWYDSNGNKLD